MAKKLKAQAPQMMNFQDDAPDSIRMELSQRLEELSQLDKEQIQMGTSVPNLYGSLAKFVANPSTVSVETYKRMLDTDETIGAGLDFMNLALISRFGEYFHPIPKIQAFVRKVLNSMEGSWHENLDEMFSAEWSGFSITEKVWKYDHDFDGHPAFIPERLATYAPLTIVFAVDGNGRLLPDGIYQYQRYYNTMNSGQSALGVGRSMGDLGGFRPDTYAAAGDMPYPIRVGTDVSFLTIKLPRKKVIHMRSSSTGKFGNPYGRSILRRVYKNWVLKDAFLRMWLIAADRKGTPLVVGYAVNHNDTVMQADNEVPDPRRDGFSTGGSAVRKMRADQALSATLATVHNSSFIVLPGKKGEDYEIDSVQIQGDMNVFKDGVDYYNRAIMRGLLLPPLILGGDGGGSFSLGQEHNKIFKSIIDGKLKPYKQAVLDQFISEIIGYNFPEGEWKAHGYGDFKLEDFDPEVMDKLATIFAGLTTAGYMSPSDQTDMDEVRYKMNLKPKVAEKDPMENNPLFGGGDEQDKSESEQADDLNDSVTSKDTDADTEEEDSEDVDES